ncbi:uncharacterized protein LOC127248701 [Andrographis paniculata]|uniref:uncharacterized protein LOC127248701 n=1 Tax=Andrographis paniculata TaxID=175694 RepID=UPI0021E7A482|nr:uncharacterized protein LOC127248701 [Andrographis paniculata]
MERMKRQSSIEKEPRTLSLHQIEFAREAALCVVNTRSIEEALRIFTEGLEPVERCAVSSGPTGGNEEPDYVIVNNDDVERFPSGLRDIVSAPF